MTTWINYERENKASVTNKDFDHHSAEMFMEEMLYHKQVEHLQTRSNNYSMVKAFLNLINGLPNENIAGCLSFVPTEQGKSCNFFSLFGVCKRWKHILNAYRSVWSHQTVNIGIARPSSDEIRLVQDKRKLIVNWVLKLCALYPFITSLSFKLLCKLAEDVIPFFIDKPFLLLSNFKYLTILELNVVLGDETLFCHAQTTLEQLLQLSLHFWRHSWSDRCKDTLCQICGIASRLESLEVSGIENIPPEFIFDRLEDNTSNLQAQYLSLDMQSFKYLKSKRVGCSYPQAQPDNHGRGFNCLIGLNICKVSDHFIQSIPLATSLLYLRLSEVSMGWNWARNQLNDGYRPLTSVQLDTILLNCNQLELLDVVGCIKLHLSDFICSLLHLRSTLKVLRIRTSPDLLETDIDLKKHQQFPETLGRLSEFIHLQHLVIFDNHRSQLERYPLRSLHKSLVKLCTSLPYLLHFYLCGYSAQTIQNEIYPQNAVDTDSNSALLKISDQLTLMKWLYRVIDIKVETSETFNIESLVQNRIKSGFDR